MRAVLQRVSSASVSINGQVIAAIGHGLLVYLGVAPDDGPADRTYIVGKIHDLRVFGDDEGRMNRSVADVGEAVLMVSQFTLCGDARRGRRPSFDAAAAPDVARGQYEAVIEELRRTGLQVECGVFQADMAVASINDGPVTLLIDSKKAF